MDSIKKNLVATAWLDMLLAQLHRWRGRGNHRVGSSYLALIWSSLMSKRAGRLRTKHTLLSPVFLEFCYEPSTQAPFPQCDRRFSA